MYTFMKVNPYFLMRNYQIGGKRKNQDEEIKRYIVIR